MSALRGTKKSLYIDFKIQIRQEPNLNFKIDV